MIDKTELNTFLSDRFEQMPIVPDICRGSLSKKQLKKVALLHYGETKTFLNFKIPARMLLCLHDAFIAKKYFWLLYREEQGDFKQNENHADFLRVGCNELGITDSQLEQCYKQYKERFYYMLFRQPSIETMVFELAVSVAWESFLPYFGSRLTSALREHYSLSEASMKYFDIHYKVDQAHSEQAINTLLYYCKSETLSDIAKKAIHTTLVSDCHLVPTRHLPVFDTIQ